MSDPDHGEYVDRVRKGLKRSGPPPESRRVLGKTYDLVGQEERVDRQWENQEAGRRRQAFAAGRRGRLEDRRRQRELLTEGERLDLALRMLEMRIGGMRSRPVASGRGGGDEHPSRIPPQTDTKPELEQRLTLIVHHVTAIEAMLDAEDGLLREEPEESQGFYGHPGHAGGYETSRMVTGRQRDATVFEDFQGVRSEVVAREAPYLGSHARTIERARTREATRRGLRVRPVDGVVLGELQ